MVAVGDKASLRKRFTEDDVRVFGHVTEDMNPLHFDAEFIKGTQFRGPVVHGILNLGLLSAVLGEFKGKGFFT